jgi:chromosome segregation ATPase
MSRKIVGVGGMRNGDIALRLSVVLSVAGFIALAASLYEVDRREKSSSGSAAVNLIEIEQQVQILGNQIRILSTQLGASERQGQALSNHIQALDLRLKELEDDLRRRR